MTLTQPIINLQYEMSALNLLNSRDFTIKDLVIGPHTQRAPYRRRTGEDKIALHWGQLKLHLSEVEFFTLYWDPAKIPRPTCVYAGAAPGTHITLLSKMFPTFTFHLYDPAKFSIEANDRIHLHNEYFTEDVARQYAGRNDILFLSDIRTADHEMLLTEELAKRGITQFDEDDEAIGPADVINEAYKVSKVRNEDQIWGDMKMQQSWVQIMNPEHALLKFRLPYALDGKDMRVQYLRGLVYWQVWPPQTSSETRLKPVRNAQGVYDVSDWSILEYEQWCFHHNFVVREQWRFKNIFNGKDEPIDAPELMNDYDSTAQAMILRLYLEKTGIRDPAQLYERVKQLSRLTTLTLNHGNADSPGLGERRAAPIKTSGRAVHDAFRKKNKDNKSKPSKVKQRTNAFNHTQIDYDTTWRAIIAPCTEVTFAVNGSGGLEHSRLINDLTSAGFKQVANNAQQVHVSWGELNYKLHPKGVYDTAFRNQQAALKAALGGQIQDITDKMNLYGTMRMYNPEGLRYLPATRPIRNVSNVAFNEILIAKPKGGFLSQGIELITNDAELQAFRTKTKDEAIVSAYLTNPLLVDGLKFHLRVYLLLYVNQGYYRAYMHNEVDVLTAAEPYQADNWRRREIHLSGMEFTTQPYAWPTSLAATTDAAVLSRANNAIPSVVEAVAIAAGQRIAPYPEAGAAMEILGLDIMFDQLGNAYLLEVNSKVGFAPMAFERGTHNVFSDAMFAWVNNSVILPHFGLRQAPQPLADGKALTAGTLTPYVNVLRNMTLLPLDQAEDDQVQALGTLGSIPEIFERVGEGLPWTVEFITEAREKARANRNNPCRDTYDWIVNYNGVVSGYVGIRPFIHGKYSGPQLYYFVNPSIRDTVPNFENAAVTLVTEFLRALAFPGKYRLYLVVGQGIPIITGLAFNKVDAAIMINNNHLDMYYTDIMPNTTPIEVRKPNTRAPATTRTPAATRTSVAPATRTPAAPVVAQAITVDVIPRIVQPTIRITTPIVAPTVSSIVPATTPMVSVIPVVVPVATSSIVPVRSPGVNPIIPVAVRSPIVTPVVRTPTIVTSVTPIVRTPTIVTSVIPAVRTPGTIAPITPAVRTPTIVTPITPAVVTPAVVTPITPAVVTPITPAVVTPITPAVVTPIAPTVVRPGTIAPIAPVVLRPGTIAPIAPVVLRPGTIAPIAPAVLRPGIIAPIASTVVRPVAAPSVSSPTGAVLRPTPLVAPVVTPLAPRSVIAPINFVPRPQGRI